MAGSFGWKFLFFSFVFYGFIAFLLTLGATSYLTATLPTVNTTLGVGNFSVFGFDTGIPNPFQNFINMFLNPFTAIGFLSWLGLAIAAVDLYIIVTSMIP